MVNLCGPAKPPCESHLLRITIIQVMARGFTISRGIDLIRASLIRARARGALLALAFAAGAMALAGCNTDDVYQVPTRAMKELSPEMLSVLDQKQMPKESPILVRIFKEESELEVWKQTTGGRYELLRVYPICRWSGELGPKVREGDRQAPEGFYPITPGLMNPNSSYYLAINTGFPNVYDKANGRSGAFLMIHGDCSSRGCYAMTDEQIGEIYSLARESFLGGQKEFQVQAYPFRMTPKNLARHRTNPNMAFWNMLKEGYDHFEVSHLEPKIDVCDRHYVFDAQSPGGSNKPLSFSPTGRCPQYDIAPEIAGPALEKQKNDDYQIAQLTKVNSPVAPVLMGTDGGMNRVFAGKLDQVSATYDADGHLHAPPVHPGMPPPTLSDGNHNLVPETTSTVATASPSPPPSSSSSASSTDSKSTGFFAKLFGPKSSSDTTKVASADPATTSGTKGGFFSNLFSSKKDTAANAPAALRGSEPTSDAPDKAKSGTQGAAAAGLRPKKTEPSKSEPKKPDSQIADSAKSQTPPQQEASATPPANNGGMLKGAQPVVPAGSFDSRFGGGGSQ
jgi:murein L,D-transpeptidase YafK